MQLDDLDRTRGTLTIRRAARDRVLFLDLLTLTFAGGWIWKRADRWPRTTNPHLIITQVTAVDGDNPPISHSGIRPMFRPTGATPSQLRIDRILDEARHRGDPIHLMRIFGIANTAIKYVKTAHPDRFSLDPFVP